MKHNYSGKSLKELKKEFGVGSKGFCEQDWYEQEAFWTEKPEAGAYEINVEKAYTNLTYDEQKEKLPVGFDFPHPAVLAEAILTHYRNTGERLLKDWYSRTSGVSLDVYRVYVGGFGSSGLGVDRWDFGDRGSSIGVSASRKFQEDFSIEPSKPFEITHNEFLMINGVKYNKACDKCGR